MRVENNKTEKVILLDVKDKKILFELSKNARVPLTKISKSVRLSRDSVNYRINQMKKNKIILNPLPVIDINKIGYTSFHIFLKLRNITESIEKEIIKKIISLDYIRAILKFHGGYDFEIALVAKNVKEFDDYLTEILNKIGNYIDDYDILIVSKELRFGSFPNSFLKEIDKKNFAKPHDKREKENLDKKDYEIVNVLKNSADLSLLKISEKVKLSPDAVSYRLKNMEKWLIKSYIPKVNYQKIGYKIYTLLANITPINDEKERKIENFLKQDENVLWAVKTIGKYNIIVYICVENEQDLHLTLNGLRNNFGENLVHYETLLAFEEYKYTYVPDCIFR